MSKLEPSGHGIGSFDSVFINKVEAIEEAIIDRASEPWLKYADAVDPSWNANRDFIDLDKELNRDVIDTWAYARNLARLVRRKGENIDGVREAVYRATSFALDVVEELLPEGSDFRPRVDSLDVGAYGTGSNLQRAVGDFLSDNPLLQEFIYDWSLELESYDVEYQDFHDVGEATDISSLGHHVVFASGLVMMEQEMALRAETRGVS